MWEKVDICYFYNISIFFPQFFTLHYGLAYSLMSTAQFSLSDSQDVAYDCMNLYNLEFVGYTNREMQ